MATYTNVYHQWIIKPGDQKVCQACGIEPKHSTRECPGRPLSEEEREKIKAQALDYEGGRWRNYVQMKW